MKIFRPVIGFLMAYIAGFLLGLYFSTQWMFMGILLVMLVTYYLIWKHMRSQKIILLAAFFLALLGMIRGTYCFYEQTMGYTGPVEDFFMEGVVISSKESAYGSRLVLRSEKWSVYVRGDTEETVEPGDRILASGTLEPLECAENPGGMDWMIYYKTQGIEYQLKSEEVKILEKNDIWFYGFKHRFSNRIYDILYAMLPEEDAGFAAAMITGDRSHLDTEIQELYRESGIAHVIAISGLHIQILFTAIYECLNRIFPKRTASVLSLFAIWFFGFLTGASVSTVRACIMLTTKYLAKLVYRRYDALNGLALAALLLLLYRPIYIMDAGFQLSFAACYGMQRYSIFIQRIYWIPSRIRRWIAPGAAVTLATLPITLYHYYQYSLYSIGLNLLIIPLMEILLIMTLVALILSFVIPAGAIGGIGIVYWILQLYKTAAKWALAIPGSIWNPGAPPMMCIIVYYGLLEIWIWKYAHRRSLETWKCGLIVLMIAGTWILQANAAEIAFLSIGQGDCAVVSSNGYTYVIDCGPGYKDVLKPYLKSRGIQEIDGVFISHMDLDHSQGVLELLQDTDMQVHNVYVPDHEIHSMAVKEVVTQADIHFWSFGDWIEKGRIRIECLSPDPTLAYEDENEASMVLYIQMQNGRILFTGDIGIETEQKISAVLTECDILKVGHHGSRTSTSELLLDCTQPKQLWISCGEGNRYGHPHEEVLDQLQKRNLSYAVSYETGAMIWNRKGIYYYKERYKFLKTFKKDGWIKKTD